MTKNISKAKWIWTSKESSKKYNQTIIAKKTFSYHSAVTKAVIRITADSFYRLYVNNVWINDGPCRAWPENYYYDELDITQHLVKDSNELLVVARYYGTGDFHRVPIQGGLLAQLDLKFLDNTEQSIITDRSWQVKQANQWISNTPKASIQMEPYEYYDARLENSGNYTDATELYESDKGPWKDLRSRDVSLLTKNYFAIKSLAGMNIVENNKDSCYCLAAAQLVHPELIEANINTSVPCAIASEFDVQQDTTIKFLTNDFKVAIDGRIIANYKEHSLNKGKHFVFATIDDLTGHQKARILRYSCSQHILLSNPVKPLNANPWCFVNFKEFAFAKNDLIWLDFSDEDNELVQAKSGYADLTQNLLCTITSAQDFKANLANRCQCLDFDTMFFKDQSWKFENRKVLVPANAYVFEPSALIKDDQNVTVVNPSKKGDIELVYDLGEQNCGYYSFDLNADEGVQIDINEVEYITDSGIVQHTPLYKNGLTYITKQGNNHFISLKRRSGRYLFVAFRNMVAPVRIRNIKLIESTYPIDKIANFVCSDEHLNKIWDISIRTLKLCMEDTFTDCPLYEQTLWVGDARNEALFALSAFNSIDITKRCIKLAAQSLERFPMISCQVPSCWETIIPAWSFLWVISAWDYYYYSGDKAFLEEMWPAITKNLKSAESYIDSNGLFSSTFWNLFDWAAIDWNKKKVVMHNSMLLVGAVQAALRCSQAIGMDGEQNWLKSLASRLSNSINKFWNDEKKAYPDSLDDNGLPSNSTCQHTSFLSILYEIVEKNRLDAAMKNLLDPPKIMVKVGSPFAIFYLYEALEKRGRDDEIVKSIIQNYLPMLEYGSTTVWESFAEGTLSHDTFPTRSHCHAWSAAPIYFFTRIILGVKAVSPAGKEIIISPRPNGLTFARGSVATINGPVEVSWRINDKQMELNYALPKNASGHFIRNDSLDGLEVIVNGKPCQSQ
ncbi:MAG: alpha-L-rhamnosidase C-terminal domain-containing protein [Phycisphaerae bacterium]|jgi:hypothetical protein